MFPEQNPNYDQEHGDNIKRQMQWGIKNADHHNLNRKPGCQYQPLYNNKYGVMLYAYDGGYCNCQTNQPVKSKKDDAGNKVIVKGGVLDQFKGHLHKLTAGIKNQPCPTPQGTNCINEQQENSSCPKLPYHQKEYLSE